jgi:hypothetical protein
LRACPERALVTYDVTSASRRVLRQQRSKFGFNAIVRRAKNLSARHDDDIDGGGRFIVPEQFPHEPLGAITLDSGTHLSCGCYSETGRARLTFPREHRHEAPGALEACLVDELKVGPLPDVLSGPET